MNQIALLDELQEGLVELKNGNVKKLEVLQQENIQTKNKLETLIQKKHFVSIFRLKLRYIKVWHICWRCEKKSPWDLT